VISAIGISAETPMFLRVFALIREMSGSFWNEFEEFVWSSDEACKRDGQLGDLKKPDLCNAPEGVYGST
jgi:hypothetical protein